MPRTRGDAGARLDVADNLDMKVFGEIGPGAMIGDDLASGVGLHLREPLVIGLPNALLEVVVALGEVGRVIGSHFREFILDSLSDAQTIFGIEPIMRIPEGMDVTLGSSDYPCGNFQNL